MLAPITAIQRAGFALLTAAVIAGVATPAVASSAETPHSTEGVSIVSSQSNLVPAGSQIVMDRAAVGVTANSTPPAGYRLYESHFYSKQSCENRGKWLRDVGHNIDNYWCTPVMQDNGRFWLYIYGFCSTDRVIDGSTVIKAGESRARGLQDS